MADIQVSDLTNATSLSDGTGVFDKLIQAVELRIENQFQKGRITGTDFATVYLGSLQSVLTQAITFILQEQEAGLKADVLDRQVLKVEEEIAGIVASTAKIYAEIALLNQKQVTELAQTSNSTGGITFAQKGLLEAQTKGFTGKHENDLLKIMLDTWSVIYSINDGELLGTDVGIPNFLEETTPVTGFAMPDVDAQVDVSSGIFTP